MSDSFCVIIFYLNEEGFYERILSNFSQGGTATTISGLILATALIAGLMIGCKEESSSKPTAPNIPIYPEGQTSENSNEMGFYSAKGDGQFGAFVNENSEFQISVPAGEFLLTYVTNSGTYYVAFRASKAAVLYIGLHQHVNVIEAAVQRGKITNESQKKWQSNDVTLFAWPGSDSAWNGVFQSDGSAAVVLIKNQTVAPGVNKLPEPSYNPQPSGGEWKVIGEIPSYNPASLPNINETDTEVTFGDNPNDSLFLTAKTSNGWEVSYYGSQQAMSAIRAKAPNGEIVIITFDEQSRPIQMSAGDGKILNFDWASQTVTVSDGSLQSLNMVGAPIQLLITDELGTLTMLKVFEKSEKFVQKLSSAVEKQIKQFASVMKSVYSSTTKLYINEEAENKVPRCFGASGSGCRTLPGRSDPIHPVRRLGSGRFEGFVTVGAIRHDTCCEQNKKGFWCDGPLSALYPGQACWKEWILAEADTASSSGWYVTFGPYEINEGDKIDGLSKRPGSSFQEYQATLKLSAPEGTKLALANEAFCASGQFKERNIIEQYGICGKGQTTSCVVSTNTDSSDGALEGSLRKILTNSACSTITFASGVKTITLDNGYWLDVARNVTIDGGSGVTITCGGKVGSIFSVKDGVTATFAGLTITGCSGGNWGGISNRGNLTLTSSTTVTGNSTPYSGGGIFNQGTLTVNGTVSGNSASGDGGGIHNGGTLTINGTVRNNTSGGRGGGIYSYKTVNGATASNVYSNTAATCNNFYDNGLNPTCLLP